MSQFVIRNDATKVELWSEIRLPFEPQGWVMEMRDTLRTAIKQLSPDGHATE